MKERLLVLAPTARDSELSGEILKGAGFRAHLCADLTELCREVANGAGAILLTDATLSQDDPERLTDILRHQPPWSDIPVILLSTRGADSPSAVWAVGTFSNITVLEQPVRVMTLVSALRTAVKARTRQYELRDRLEALRRADRQKDEFLATLSHELRNPLAPISNAIQLLRMAGADAATRERVLGTLDRQVRTVVRLVDDLLELSRITHGKIELRRERLALEELLRTAAESIAPFIERREHELTVVEPAEPVLVDGDPVRLNQVITNLLNNAARYTDRGGAITLAGSREGAEAVISVRDTGIGIGAEMLPHVFDLFVQAEQPGERQRQGLGVGLTLVKHLVEQHGGRVEVHSAGLGQGSEFRIRLPVAAEVATTTEPGTVNTAEPSTARDDVSGLRILVVDDHQEAADTLAALLRVLGYTVHVAYDGPAALGAAPGFKPDVAILDLSLPGMDGHELAVRLRREAGLERALMLALSGYGRDEDRRRSREAGFDGHLVKPLDLDALRTQLAAVRPRAPGGSEQAHRRRAARRQRSR